MIRNSFAACSFGLRVKYLLTVLIWWNWQTCIGMSLNTALTPGLPSITTASKVRPSSSKTYLASWYTAAVSLLTSVQKRFCLRSKERNTRTPYSLPKKITSAMATTGLGKSWNPFGSALSSCLRIQSTLRWFSAPSCRAVCLPQT